MSYAAESVFWCQEQLDMVNKWVMLQRLYSDVMNS